MTRFDQNKSEFYTFTAKDSGTQGEIAWFQLNVGGAREVVFATVNADNPDNFCWGITNQTYDQTIDVAGGTIATDAQWIPIINSASPLVVHCNDEYLNVFGDPDAKFSADLHVWVIR